MTKSKLEEAAEAFAEVKGNGIGDWFERKEDYMEGARWLLAEAEKMAEKVDGYNAPVVFLYKLKELLGEE